MLNFGVCYRRLEIELEIVIIFRDEKDYKFVIKGFSFEDDRFMGGNWLKEKNLEIMLLFFRIFVVCYIVILELNEDIGSFIYEVEFLDEVVFFVVVREFGFEFCK